MRGLFSAEGGVNLGGEGKGEWTDGCVVYGLGLDI